MDSKELLKSEIRRAFGDVDFPSHCGWNAAIAKDDWISDPEKLIQITNDSDIKGKWWEIPFTELKNCSLAQCYLDAKGVEFYLPAYMTGVIDDTSFKNYKALYIWLEPGINDSECNLYDYFCDNFKLINGSKKQVCIKVLGYLIYNLEPNDKYSKEEIEKILEHEFWAGKC